MHAMPDEQPRVQQGAAAEAGVTHTHVFSTREVMVPVQVRRAPLDDGRSSACSTIRSSPSPAPTARSQLKGLPPGTYTIEAWHEKLGTQTQTRDDRREGQPRTSRSRSRCRAPELLHLFAAARRRLHGDPDLRRRPGDEHRLRPVGARLAEHLRLVHVRVSAREDGRRHLLRAHAPADRQHRRLPDHGAGVLALARRAAALGAPARVHRARRRRHAGHARRHHRPLVPARPDLDRARQPGADRLLPDRDDRAGHVAGMAARVRHAAPAAHARAADDPTLRTVAVVTTALASTCRSSSARPCGTPTPGWRFRTSRWSSAGSIPPHWDAKIAMHYAHRVGALIVTAAGRWRRRRTSSTTIARRRELVRPSVLLLVLRDHPDHARRADDPERQALHHQLAARRDRRLGPGHVARADAARASRPVRPAATHRRGPRRQRAAACDTCRAPAAPGRGREAGAQLRTARRPAMPRAVALGSPTSSR